MNNKNIKLVLIISLIVIVALFLTRKLIDDAILIPDSPAPVNESEERKEESEDSKSQENFENLEKLEEIEETEKTEEVEPQILESYIDPAGMIGQSRINTPETYSRIDAESGSFLEFVRSLDVKEDGSPVLLYDGSEKRNQSAQVAVYTFDIGNSDLQQCADSIMRVYSEYYWEKEAYESIEFHLTNGFLMDYTSWRDGKRIQVDGNNVSWVNSASYDDSYENFRNYLTQVMIYAGTLSLDKESTTIGIEDLRAGDMILKGGSPGHCVLIVDEAQNDKGDSCYLLAQGYMPAQDFHILKNPRKGDCPWYFEEDLKGSIQTPEYPFNENDLKRWNNGFD